MNDDAEEQRGDVSVGDPKYMAAALAAILIKVGGAAAIPKEAMDVILSADDLAVCVVYEHESSLYHVFVSSREDARQIGEKFPGLGTRVAKEKLN